MSTERKPFENKNFQTDDDDDNDEEDGDVLISGKVNYFITNSKPPRSCNQTFMSTSTSTSNKICNFLSTFHAEIKISPCAIKLMYLISINSRQ